MPLSELTELVAKIDGADLKSPERRSAMAGQIAQLQTMLDRLGATESAAQLGVAAHLLQRTGDGGTSDEDAKRMVRTLLVAVENSFHLPTGAPTSGTAPESARARNESQGKPKETRQKKKARAAELAVVKDMLLGEILVHFDVLTPDEISAALELQHDTGKRLGEILVDSDFTTRDEIKRALDYQNTIRKRIAEKPKASTAAADRRKASTAAADRPASSAPRDPAQPQPRPVLPASDGTMTRLRLATELLLGEMLILNGAITREELVRALELQRSSGLLIGEALIQTGAANRAAIERALVSQGRGDRIGRNRSA